MRKTNSASILHFQPATRADERPISLLFMCLLAVWQLRQQQSAAKCLNDSAYTFFHITEKKKKRNLFDPNSEMLGLPAHGFFFFYLLCRKQ